MKDKILNISLPLLLLLSFNAFSQWTYPNAKNIENDVIITYEVKYERELTEKLKNSSRFKKEIVVTFNKNKLLEKALSPKKNVEYSFLFDYEDEIAYSILKYGSKKEAIKSKFKNPVKKTILKKNTEVTILGFPCQVSTIMVKSKLREIYTTKKIGLKYVKYYKTEGFLLKYTAYDKYFGPYTVTAKSISYATLPASTYSLEGYTIRSKEEQKEYLSKRKERKNKQIKEVEKIEGHYTKYESKHMQFNKFECKVGDEEIKQIENMIEFQSNYYEALFKVKIKPVKIKLFGDFKTYKNLQKYLTSLDSDTGFYSGKMRTIYVYKSDNFLRTIYHEINHAIVRQIITSIPSWINEGMAEFFEYFSVKNTGVSIKIQHNRLNKVRAWIKNDEIKLKEFLSFSNKEWKKKNYDVKSYSYTVSYSLVYYLFVRYPGAIGKILKHLKKGETSIKAIEIATKQKLEFLEKDFKTFI